MTVLIGLAVVLLGWLFVVAVVAAAVAGFLRDRRTARAVTAALEAARRQAVLRSIRDGGQVHSIPREDIQP